jgi:NitT/TauT family transport system substrate-binding protein
MAYPVPEAGFAPFFIAADKGYLAEEGLAVELITSGGSTSTAALIAGEVNYIGSAATAVNAALTGAPLKVIYTLSDRPLSEVWTIAPDVRTLADVRGKPVAVINRGDTNEVALRLALVQQGIDPDSPTYVPVGVGSQRIAAIQSGAVAAAVLQSTEAVELQEALPQAQRVADLREQVQMLMGGLATHQRELTEHRERTRRFLRAAMKAREYYKAFREETLQILMKHSQSSRAAAEGSYDAHLSTMSGDASMSVEVQRRDTAARAELNGVTQHPPAEELYDYTLVKDLHQELQASRWQPTR